nr:AsmA-like C-terminal domain-containing protein [Roseospira goensis]
MRLGLVVGLVLLALVAAAWTLSRGPLDVPFLVPRIETALTDALDDAGLPLTATVGGAALTWGGPAAGLDVALRDVRLDASEAAPLARVGTVSVGLDPGALLHGELVLSDLVLLGPELTVRRGADGTLGVALQPPPAPTPDSTPDSTPAPNRDPAPSGPAVPATGLVQTWAWLADLGLTLRDAHVRVEDQALGRTWRLRASTLTVTRAGGALSLEGSLTLDDPQAPPATGTPAARPAAVDVALRHAPGTASGPRLASALVAFEHLDPGRDLAGLLGLPTLAGWRQPLSGTLTVDVDLAALTGPLPSDPLAVLRYASLSLGGAAGRAVLPAPVAHGYDLRGLALEARATRDAAGVLGLHLDTLTLGLDGTTVTADGRLTAPAGGPLDGTAALTLSAVDVPTVVRHWPPELADGARKWIDANLSDGRVAGASAVVTLGGPDWSGLTVTGLDGAAPVSGMTVRYLKGLPPASDARGTVRFGLDAVTIDIAGGGAGDLAVTGGTVAFTDFDADVERADMTFEIVGPLPAALALIDHDPLGYASQVGIDPGQTRGETRTTLTLGMPLLKDLALDALEIGVQANASGVALPGVALGQDLADGDLRLTLDGTGMDVTGTARVGGVPVRLDWRENFTDGAAFDRRYRVSGRLDNAARARFRLDGGPFQPPWMDGPVDATLTYTETAGRPGRLDADVDLSPTTLAVDPLGWRKPAGTPARAMIAGTFADAAMTVDFDVTTATDDAVRGQARLSGAGALRAVTLDRAALGATDVTARVTAPATAGDPYAFVVRGPSLDLRPLLAEDGAAGETTSAAPAQDPAETPPETPSGPPLDLSLDLARVRLTETVTLAGLRAGVTRDAAGRWAEAEADARIGADGPPLRLTLAPEGGDRRFTVTAGDAGAVARALDLTGQVRGGRLRLTGTLDARDAVQGRLEVTDFHLADAPVLARILSVAALTGILDELQGTGLSVSTLVAPFTYADSLLTLTEARANGPSLGVTANGTIDLAADGLDLEGVVVPLYLVNALVGNIPLVGDLLVGEKGGGVFAVAYRATGPIDDPAVSVNPLSVLTPGFLRGLFGALPEGNADRPVTMPSVGPPD